MTPTQHLLHYILSIFITFLVINLGKKNNLKKTRLFNINKK